MTKTGTFYETANLIDQICHRYHNPRNIWLLFDGFFELLLRGLHCLSLTCRKIIFTWLMSSFKPSLSVLPKVQKEIWPALDKFKDCFILQGGTAIALQLGHRVSVDCNFSPIDSFIQMKF